MGMFISDRCIPSPNHPLRPPPPSHPHPLTHACACLHVKLAGDEGRDEEEEEDEDGEFLNTAPEGVYITSQSYAFLVREGGAVQHVPMKFSSKATAYQSIFNA
jgi:hypothetical protein